MSVYDSHSLTALGRSCVLRYAFYLGISRRHFSRLPISFLLTFFSPISSRIIRTLKACTGKIFTCNFSIAILLSFIFPCLDTLADHIVKFSKFDILGLQLFHLSCLYLSLWERKCGTIDLGICASLLLREALLRFVGHLRYLLAEKNLNGFVLTGLLRWFQGLIEIFRGHGHIFVFIVKMTTVWLHQFR